MTMIVEAERNIQITINLTQPYPGQVEVMDYLEKKKLTPFRIKDQNYGGQTVRTLFFSHRYLSKHLERLKKLEEKGEKINAIENYLFYMTQNSERRYWAPLTEGMTGIERDKWREKTAIELYEKFGDKIVKREEIMGREIGDYYFRPEYDDAAREFLKRNLPKKKEVE